MREAGIDDVVPSLGVADDAHVRVLTINRPERRNALDTATAAALVSELLRATSDPDVWVVVVTGAGEDAFCAGRDLKELDDASERGEFISSPMDEPNRNVHEALLETYKPTIAAINGPAVGGGFELALACDVRLIAEDAYLALPEVKRGMGANAASVMLFQTIPRARAFEMLYLGEPVTSLQAYEWGLVNGVVPQPELMPRALELAARVATGAPLTLRRYKEMATKSWGLPVAAGLRLNVGPNPYQSEDRREGVRAFVEKREPRWKNR